jgi:ABC-type Mn2+/Zn2+ transport system permease subunit
MVLLAREYNHLLLDSLSPPLAGVEGSDSRFLDYFFAFLLALSIVVSLKIIGALLVEALVVVPAAASRNVARSARGYLVWSVAVAFVAGAGGLVVSNRFLVPTGAAVVLGASLAFFVTLVAGAVGRDALALRGRRSAGIVIVLAGLGLLANRMLIGALLVAAGAYFFKFGWPSSQDK